MVKVSLNKTYTNLTNLTDVFDQSALAFRSIVISTNLPIWLFFCFCLVPTSGANDSKTREVAALIKLRFLVSRSCCETTKVNKVVVNVKGGGRVRSSLPYYFVLKLCLFDKSTLGRTAKAHFLSIITASMITLDEK